jgi:hypothetical protein
MTSSFLAGTIYNVDLVCMRKGTVGALHRPDAAARRPGQSKKQGRGFIRVPVAALFCDYLISVKEQCLLAKWAQE